MKHRLKQATLALVLPLTLLLASCGDEAKTTDTDGLQAIKDRDVVRIAVFSDKPPFGYMDREGKNQGYDIELAKRIAQDLLGDESKVEFVPTEAQHRVEVLRSNKVDITLANFTITPERADQVDFAEGYMKTAIGIISPKSAPIKTVDDLEGKVLIVNKGTTSESYFAEHYPDIQQLKYDHNTEAFAALKDGRGAGLAHDNTLLYAWANENPEFTVALNQIGPDDIIAPAVKKGNSELLEWLNREIIMLQKEGFFHKAYDKSVKPFYGDDVDPSNVIIEPSN